MIGDNIIIASDDIPHCYMQWLKYRIPKGTIKKSVKNRSIELITGIKFIFLSNRNSEKVRGMNVQAVIVDEAVRPVKDEIVKELAHRVFVTSHTNRN